MSYTSVSPTSSSSSAAGIPERVRRSPPPVLLLPKVALRQLAATSEVDRLPRRLPSPSISSSKFSPRIDGERIIDSCCTKPHTISTHNRHQTAEICCSRGSGRFPRFALYLNVTCEVVRYEEDRPRANWPETERCLPCAPDSIDRVCEPRLHSTQALIRSRTYGCVRI